MYIKAWQNQGLQMAAFRAISLAAQSHAVAGEGKAAVCDLSPRAGCVPAFDYESERGAFVREVENRDKKRFEAALWR